jgi:hypothetical protein
MRLNASKINLLLIYPGALIRMLIYWNKRTFKELVDDGLEINAMALLWVAVMVIVWYRIMVR